MAKILSDRGHIVSGKSDGQTDFSEHCFLVCPLMRLNVPVNNFPVMSGRSEHCLPPKQQLSLSCLEALVFSVGGHSLWR